MFSLLFSVFFLPLLLLLHSTNAVFVKRDGVNLNITTPNHSSLWFANTTEVVSWSTDHIISEADDSYIDVLFGYVDNGSNYVDTNNPLATHVLIMNGEVQVTVPANTVYRTSYFVALSDGHDSLDTSETFTIVDYK